MTVQHIALQQITIQQITLQHFKLQQISLQQFTLQQITLKHIRLKQFGAVQILHLRDPPLLEIAINCDRSLRPPHQNCIFCQNHYYTIKFLSNSSVLRNIFRCASICSSHPISQSVINVFKYLAHLQALRACFYLNLKNNILLQLVLIFVP